MRGKAGIVSLYIGQNFGNKLQNYAVEMLLKRHGYDPYTFRYAAAKTGTAVVRTSALQKLKPKYVMTFLKIRLSRKLPMKNSDTSILCRLAWLAPDKQRLMQNARRQQQEVYRRFDEKYLHFSDIFISENENEWGWTEDFRCFVCGSDQVWNPYYASTNKLCFLQFAPVKKRIALSPSFGVSQIPAERQEEFSSWLKSIPSLSVREDAGAQIIRELTGRDAQVLVDPTMCLTGDEWQAFEEKPAFALPERYVLTYFLGDRTREYEKEVERQARALDCRIVHLLDLMQPEYYGCSPNEFVYCIRHAQAVCTDSFHASVFSILFSKVFTTFERIEGDRRMSSRIVTLLKSFGLTDRFYQSGTQPSLACDFSKCGLIVQRRREEMDCYLRAALNEVNQ